MTISQMRESNKAVPSADTRLTLLDDVRQPARAQIEIRRSRFIAQAVHSTSWQEALEFIEQVRASNPKARHVAYAGVWAGSPDSNAGVSECSTADTSAMPTTRTMPTERMSDDGEPSGTAGKPILNVITARNMTDCIVTVTRYFGGVLLGAPGLVRAYSSATSQALASAHLASIVPCQRLGLAVNYAQYEPCRRLIASCDGAVSDENFTEIVHLNVTIPQRQLSEFTAAFAQQFHDCPPPVAQGKPENVAIPVRSD